jgi:Flp pilus assembly protein TadG
MHQVDQRHALGSGRLATRRCTVGAFKRPPTPRLQARPWAVSPGVNALTPPRTRRGVQLPAHLPPEVTGVRTQAQVNAPTPPGSGRLARLRRERGQGLVEFSLMAVFLSILLMGVLDLGRAYFTYLALKDAAQEGAYYGSAFPQCVDINGINSASPACAGANTIDYRVRNAAPRGGLVDWTGAGAAQVTTVLPCGSANPCVMQAGQRLTVTVSYQYHMLTPLVGTIANGQILTLTAQSSAVIVRVPNCTVAPTCQ